MNDHDDKTAQTTPENRNLMASDASSDTNSDFASGQRTTDDSSDRTGSDFAQGQHESAADTDRTHPDFARGQRTLPEGTGDDDDGSDFARGQEKNLHPVK